MYLARGNIQFYVTSCAAFCTTGGSRVVHYEEYQVYVKIIGTKRQCGVESTTAPMAEARLCHEAYQ